MKAAPLKGVRLPDKKIVADSTIIAVIGTTCSDAGVPMAELISEAGYVMVSPSNTAPALTDPLLNWHLGYLRTAHNDLDFGQK
jgi:branched-chain amino acid transport system substrate-binding protein